jgi:putative thiamine transport system permease protein
LSASAPAAAARAAAGCGVRGGWLALAPVLTVAAFALPIGAGLVGTLLPAFGHLPALGRTGFGLDAWRALFAYPGFATSLATTVAIGVAATLLSVAIALGIAAALRGRRAASRIGAAVAPLMAMPHAALAIGVAFLVAPSGWIARAVSPVPSGWEVPPDLLTVGHPSGWPVVLSLLLKEVPYLLLMLLGALHQVPAGPRLEAARALGYPPALAWFKVVLPAVWPQLRLPAYAVLAYSLSTVEVAMILGPANPPTLAALAVRWFGDPDPAMALPASAAATLLLGLVLAALGAMRAIELAIARAGRAWLERGGRGGGTGPARASVALGAALLAAAIAAIAGLLLWSFARRWRFPDAWPDAWTLDTWARQSTSLAGPLATTVLVGAIATALALVLAIACLEHEARRGARGRPGRALSLLYLPLLVPQVAFLFGAQVLLLRAGLDGGLAAVVWAHLVYVLPYVFLSLADPWRAFDARYERTALALGRSRAAVFLRVKLPMLLAPVAIAAAVGFAVSAGQYLPTLFAGAGRVVTLTTEAVTLSGGADRRVIGAWAVLQAALPMLAYLAAVALPALLFRNRRGLAG